MSAPVKTVFVGDDLASAIGGCIDGLKRERDNAIKERDTCLEALKKIAKLQLHLTARCHNAGPNLDECALCIAQSAIALCEKGQQ